MGKYVGAVFRWPSFGGGPADVSGLGMNAGEADFTPRFSDRSHLPSTLPEFPERSILGHRELCANNPAA